MFINSINPVLISLGPFQVRYYGLFVAISLIITYFFLRYFSKKGYLELSKDQAMDTVMWTAIGGVIGARIFYALVYNPSVYFPEVWKIFYIWQGGLSFHGGLIGSLIGLFIYCKKQRLDFLRILDFGAIPIAILLVLGRVANFLNSELVGRVTEVWWAVNFNNETDPLGNLVYRHPSQLYESVKNAFIFLVLWWLKDAKLKKGMLFGSFIFMYSVLRFLIGFVRAPDPQVGYLLLGLTMGQILNSFLFFFSLGFLFWAYSVND